MKTPTHKIKTLKVTAENFGSGYPQTDIGKDGVMTKGRWMSGVKQKTYIDARGTGAATKGKKFLNK